MIHWITPLTLDPSLTLQVGEGRPRPVFFEPIPGSVARVLPESRRSLSVGTAAIDAVGERFGG